MALQYLFDPNKQFQNIDGVNNVSGFLRVFLNGTDDRATTYRNFDGSLNEPDIVLDTNGRAVVIVDDTKTYRLEVYSPLGDLMWTVMNYKARGGSGGGSTPVEVEGTAGEIDVYENTEGGVKYFVVSLATIIKNAISSLTSAVNELAISLSGKKERQNAKEFLCGTTKTLINISQDENGEMYAMFDDISFPDWTSAINNAVESYASPKDHTHQVIINGETKTIDKTGGVPVNLGTFLTSHQDLSSYLTKDGDGSDVTATFSQAVSRTNISTGEKLSVIFGKIMKWFSELKTVAFTGNYSDLNGTPSIPAAPVQSNWNESDSSSLAYIQNKPNIPAAANNGTINVYQNSVLKQSFTVDQSGNTDIYLSDTTYSSLSESQGGTSMSLVTTGEKYTWNRKQDALPFIQSTNTYNICVSYAQESGTAEYSKYIIDLNNNLLDAGAKNIPLMFNGGLAAETFAIPHTVSKFATLNSSDPNNIGVTITHNTKSFRGTDINSDFTYGVRIDSGTVYIYIPRDANSAWSGDSVEGLFAWNTEAGDDGNGAMTKCRSFYGTMPSSSLVYITSDVLINNYSEQIVCDGIFHINKTSANNHFMIKFTIAFAKAPNQTAAVDVYIYSQCFKL